MNKEQFLCELQKVVKILETDPSWEDYDLEFHEWLDLLDSIYFQEVD